MDEKNVEPLNDPAYDKLQAEYNQLCGRLGEIKFHQALTDKETDELIEKLTNINLAAKNLRERKANAPTDKKD